MGTVHVPGTGMATRYENFALPGYGYEIRKFCTRVWVCHTHTQILHDKRGSTQTSYFCLYT